MPNYSKHEQLFKTWLLKQEGFSAGTKNSYLRTVLNFLSYLEAFKIKRLNDVGQSKLNNFVYLKSDKTGYSLASIKVRVAAIDLFFTWAYERKLCRENPLIAHKKTKIKLKTLSARTERSIQVWSCAFLSEQEQKILLNTPIPRDDFLAIRNHCIITLILGSLITANETIQLNLTDVDLSIGILKIEKEGILREVPFDLTICRKPLIAWLNLRKTFLTNDNSRLFVNRNNKSLTTRSIHNIVSTTLESQVITKDSSGPELLRQTGIFNKFKQGLALEQIQKLTGITTLPWLEKNTVSILLIYKL